MPAPTVGRQISRQGFPTKKAAEAALNEVLQKAAQGTVVSKSSVRVREYLDDWLKSQASRLRETTLRSYEIAVGRIVQRLGSVPLQSLTPLQIETFYAGLLDDGGKSEQGLAAKTVRNTHVVLRKALADAERLGLVPRNAVSAAHAPTARCPEFGTWSSDDLTVSVWRQGISSACGSLSAAERGVIRLVPMSVIGTGGGEGGQQIRSRAVSC